MNYDQFTFFNQQLAAMLREGVPLEGALKELCRGMRDGNLKRELEKLEQELTKGVPLRSALSKRQLPELYVRMLQLGAAGQDLPAVLTLVADHYHRVNVLWTKIKGLLVYPVLVLAVSLAFSFVLSAVISRFQLTMEFARTMGGQPPVAFYPVWGAPVVMAMAALAVVAALSVPRLRARLRWSIPLLRDASLAQTASVIGLLLKRGATLAEALGLAERLESNSPAGPALGRWRELAEKGARSPADWRAENRPFPPLFSWLVKQGGEDVAAGFEHASRLYGSRASYRTDLALYGVLPVAILLLAQMLLWQVTPLFSSMVWFMNVLGDGGL